MSNDKNRVDFKLPHSMGQFFVQQPEEYIIDTIQIGQEKRFGEGAYHSTDVLSVHKEDLPDLLDAVADYHQLPKYTDLLNIVDDLKDLYAKEEPSAGIPEYHIFDKIKAMLEGRNV